MAARGYLFSPSALTVSYTHLDLRSFGRNLDRHLDALIPALLAGQKPPVPARRGLRALELAYGAIRSFETGQRIEMKAD